MKGLEEAPMRAVEEQLRDAFSAAADTITAQHLPGLPAPARRIRMTRRWPGWLAPVAAAATVAGVIIASLGISGVILGRPAGTGPASSSRVFAEVPRYFVATSEIPGRGAVVGATATGAVLGRIAPPEPSQDFTWEAAAGDGRTFVLGASPKLSRGAEPPADQPVKFYRLVVGRSGQLGQLAPLPIPAETGVSGLAVSPDGGKLAVSLLPAHRQAVSRIQVFSLATGGQREWVWPGPGTIGQAATSFPNANISLQWEADNRTLMFEVTMRTSAGWASGGVPSQLYLLDTATSGGSLLASSTRIPLPDTEFGAHHSRQQYIFGMPFVTGDGSKLVALFYRQAPPPKVNVFTITEFSMRTGKPIGALYRLRSGTDLNSPGVWWVNTSGNAAILARGPVFGVQTPTTFTPLPPAAQRLLARPDGSLHLLPAWG
ncbi:MAG TPA: hypothetical protein VH641_19155 [Streptosporangiaceae bacterium]